MEVVNPFILKNKIGMVKFIDELCNVDFIDPTLLDKPIADCNNNGNGAVCLEEEAQDYAQDLAMIHNICESYLNEIEQVANSLSGARKLAATLSILSQHKQYYTGPLWCKQ